MNTTTLNTAINSIKCDNGNRRALRALAVAYKVDLSEAVQISPKNKSGHYNFGEIAECIIRLAYGQRGMKQGPRLADLTLDGKQFEIKALNRDGKPSPTKSATPTTPTLIVANVASFERGVYAIPYGEIVWNTSKHMVASQTLAKAKLVRAF